MRAYKELPNINEELSKIFFNHEKRHGKPAYGFEFPKYKARMSAKRFVNLLLEKVKDVEQLKREFNSKYNENTPKSEEPMYIFYFPWLDHARMLLIKYLKLPNVDQSIIFEAAQEGVHWRGEGMKQFYSGTNSIYNIVMKMRASNLTAEQYALNEAQKLGLDLDVLRTKPAS